MTHATPRLVERARRTLGAIALGVLFTGCLGEPEIEDRWTRVDVLSANIVPGQMVSAGTQTITVETRVTYRSILTGAVVAELRTSPTLTSADVQLTPDTSREVMADEVARVLANSVTAGRSVQHVTGWHHLIHEFDLSFDGRVPAGSDSSAAGLFLVAYMAETDEIELADGSDSLVVTPLDNDAYEILPVGFSLEMAP